MKFNEFCSYKNTSNRGLGVFTNQAIEEGTVIIKDIFSTLSRTEKKILMKSKIYHFLFVDRDEYSVSPDSCDLHAIWGPISIVNHSGDPNCFLNWTHENEIPIVELISMKRIEEGMELFIEYKNSEEYPVGSLI